MCDFLNDVQSIDVQNYSLVVEVESGFAMQNAPQLLHVLHCLTPSIEMQAASMVIKSTASFNQFA